MKIEINNGQLSFELYGLLPVEQRNRILTSDNECDLDPSFMGFVETYYMLSQLIPTDFTIVDIGAAFAPQCYFFRNHERYIAVEPSVKETFRMDNTVVYNVTAGKFIDDILPTLGLDMDRTFAICNYVPDWYGENPIDLTRMTFPKCYTYYPRHL